MVKIPNAEWSDQEERISSLPANMINPVLDSLNQLGAMAWKINPTMLDIAKEIFVHRDDSKLRCATSIPVHPDKIPPPVLPPDIKNLLEKDNKLNRNHLLQYQDYRAKMAIHTQLKNQTYSLWCHALYQLSMAEHFKNNVLWFPHNFDFRGRVYPMPPYLNRKFELI